MKDSGRIVSVDALRGFDMFWIIGGDFLVHYLFEWTGAPVLGAASAQLHHADWAGFHAYDLVFPVFMFLSGVSLGLVSERSGPTSQKKITLRRATQRAAILFALGVMYNWGWNIDLAQTRFASVLGLIGGAYLIAVIVMTLSSRFAVRFSAIITILVVVSVLQLFIPVPGIGAGVLTPEGSINGWIDRRLLPGRLYGGVYDPEGLLGVFSGASITLAGVLVGTHMMAERNAGRVVHVGRIALAGLALILIGLALSPVYPPIKKIWTASFDIMSIGASMMLLSGAIMLFDRKPHSRIALFFMVIGANSILIYMAARYFVYPIYKVAAAESWPPGVSAIVIAVIIALEWAALYTLYRKQVFLRV